MFLGQKLAQGSDRSFTLTSLQPDTTYDIRIRALAGSTEGTPTGYLVLTTDKIQPPKMVLDVQGQPGKSGGEIDVSWTYDQT